MLSAVRSFPRNKQDKENIMKEKSEKTKQDRIPDFPMTVDDLVVLDNIPDSREPDELVALRERSPQYISALRSSTKPELALEKVKGRNIWELQMGREFVLGQVGENAEALPRPKTVTDVSSFEPNQPAWSGVTYHPKLSAARPIRPFRRVKGQRTRPDGYIFGPDDRQVYYPNSYPWRCIGLVLAWTNPSGGPAWVGTGALVGKNVVITASHVCPWGSSPWMMQFIPAYYDGSSLSGVSSYVQTYRGYRNPGQGDDMATLKLYTPLGNTLGYFGYKTYNDDWEDGNYWTKCGYPGAVASGQRPSRVTWFQIVDDDNDGAGVELEYKADSSSGDSGGPVFGWWNGSPYVIGTHSGGEEEYHFPFSMVKNNVAAGGSALSNLIGWARNNW
jgi:V8-like Glu-specific endopeptidase